jgi:spore germination protein YaaH
MKLRQFFGLFLAMSAVPAMAARISVWVAPWDANSLTSLQLHAGAMSESNPVWYSMDPSGGIVLNWNGENPTWRAAMTGTEIVPTIQNVVNGSYNADVVLSLIATTTSRDAHAEKIRQLAVNKAFDGIDIDYEALPATARPNFTAFIEVLGAKLHQSGKKLSVTVHPKTSDSQNWNGPGSQDWAAIGNVADSVKIMAYDYHWSTSDAGPITPLTWLDAVATYAESTISAGKVMMGLPWYGYDWSGTNGATVDYASATAKAQSVGATITHDSNGEATYSYSGRTVFFQDASSYSKKIEILQRNHPALGGFAHWRGGNEDPATWTIISNLANGGSGGSTLPPVDFLINGVSTLSLVAGNSVATNYTLVPVNDFAADTTVSVTPVGTFPGSATVTPTTIRPGVATTLNVSTNKRAATGNYQLKLRFVSGSLVHEQLVSVAITAAPKRQRTTTH